jgi:hypothetical protein
MLTALPVYLLTDVDECGKAQIAQLGISTSGFAQVHMWSYTPICELSLIRVWCRMDGMATYLSSSLPCSFQVPWSCCSSCGRVTDNTSGFAEVLSSVFSCEYNTGYVDKQRCTCTRRSARTDENLSATEQEPFFIPRDSTGLMWPKDLTMRPYLIYQYHLLAVAQHKMLQYIILYCISSLTTLDISLPDRTLLPLSRQDGL